MKLTCRIITLIAVITLLCCSFVSCSNGDNKNHTFEELSFTLPRRMRKLDNENSDAYYSTPECGFTITKLTPERLDIYKLDESATLKECLDAYIEKSKIDKEQTDLVYNEQKNAYYFRYSLSLDGTEYYFHYNVFIEGSENKYFIDMTCEYDQANYYLPFFKEWGNTITAS